MHIKRYIILLIFSLNLNTGQTNKRKCSGRVTYRQSCLVCENRVPGEKVIMTRVCYTILLNCETVTSSFFHIMHCCEINEQGRRGYVPMETPVFSRKQSRRQREIVWKNVLESSCKLSFILF
jgi:hypothetical protein